LSSDKRKRVAHRPSLLERLLQDHVRALSAAFEAMARKPISSLVTAFVIGITLALPAGLHTLLLNLDQGDTGLQGSLRASLFLNDNTSQERGMALTKEITHHTGVSATRYISRAQALEDFRTYSGFAAALDLLKDNPLPATIVVSLDSRLPRPEVEDLLHNLAKLPEVAQAKLDEVWLQRLYAILALVQRAVVLIASALALSVLVVIGNTVRLDVEGRREEIGVLKLIGAAPGYIRRPYLYTGICYGLGGGILACLLVEAGVLALSEPAQQLSGLYDNTVRLHGLSFNAVVALFAAGAGLGWLGALWAVSRQLLRVEPAP
jgi:cell division transport system permease protein